MQALLQYMLYNPKATLTKFFVLYILMLSWAMVSTFYVQGDSEDINGVKNTINKKEIFTCTLP